MSILVNIIIIDQQSSENPIFFISIIFILLLNLYLIYKGHMWQIIPLYSLVVFSGIFTYFIHVKIEHEIIVISMLIFISIFWAFISYKKWHLLLHFINVVIILAIRISNFQRAYKNSLISEDTYILLINSYLYMTISLIFIIGIFYIMERELQYSNNEVEKQKLHTNMYEELIYLLEHDLSRFDDSKYNLEAYFDSLTNCLNRLAYHKFFLPCALNKYKQLDFFLTFIDLNKLKYVNDKYGHAEGDKYIKDFVDCIIADIDQKQGFFRIGGDEFILISSGISKSDLVSKLDLANSKLKKISSFYVGFSYGIASKNELDVPCIDKLEELADSRMYIMKEQTR